MVLRCSPARMRSCPARTRTRPCWNDRPASIGLLCFVSMLVHVPSSLAADRSVREPLSAPIAALTVTTAEGTVIVRHDGAAWQIVAPIRTVADHTAVSQLVDAITTCVLMRPSTLPAPVPDADQPQMTLRVHLRDGTTFPRIQLGSTATRGTTPWGRVDDDSSAFALTPECWHRLHVDLRTLRSMTIVPLSSDDIVSIAVHGSGVATTLARDGVTWQVQLPTVSPADPARVQTFLTQLRDLAATATIDQPAASLRLYGLAPPAFTVTLGARDGQIHTVTFGRGRGTSTAPAHWYARRHHDDTILRLDHAPLDQWDTSLADLRDLRLPVTDTPDAIRVIQVDRPGHSAVTLLREPDDQWRLSGQRRAAVDPAAVGRFVTTLANLRGTSIVADPPGNLAAYGLAHPDLTIHAFDAQGTMLGTVVLTRPDAQTQRPSYGMRQGGGRVLAFEPWIYEALNLHTRDGLIMPRRDADASQDESWADEEPPRTAIAPAGRLRSLTRQETAQ